MSRPLETWERQETLDRMHARVPSGEHRHDVPPPSRQKPGALQKVEIPYRALSLRRMCRHMIGLVHSDPRGWHAEWLMMVRDHGMCPGCAYNGYAHEQGCPIALMCHVASGLGHAAGEWPDDWRAS